VCESVVLKKGGFFFLEGFRCGACAIAVKRWSQLQVVNDIIWISCNTTIQPNNVPSSMAFETLGLSTVSVGNSTTSFDSFPILPSQQYFRARQYRRGGFAESVSFQQHHSPIPRYPAPFLRFLPSLLFPSLQLISASSLLFKDLYSVRLFSASSRIEQACFIAV
jgi:hypothetical protein